MKEPRLYIVSDEVEIKFGPMEAVLVVLAFALMSGILLAAMYAF